ncbi:MAG: DUF962 domain-containing protein [Gammaproteobacteria bacterium]|nr:DUF962 domain-containing protein [Gammaproteobacteria bacterium]MDH4256737.1 DUF962 domain-containing protein [Gammaproteobacteria bacterium]MDH5312051.1 DUF962 domain-containing protein [Gammaproteobacteria bacterium]
MRQQFANFAEFYPYYLEEHSHPVCRALHYTGSLLVLALFGYTIVTGSWRLLLLLPLVGYGFAWIGHFGFERNRPATFRYPMYSLLGDWVMLWDFLSGRRRAQRG